MYFEDEDWDEDDEDVRDGADCGSTEPSDCEAECCGEVDCRSVRCLGYGLCGVTLDPSARSVYPVRGKTRGARGGVASQWPVRPWASARSRVVAPAR